MIIVIGNIIGVSIKNIANNTPNDDISFPPFFMIILNRVGEVKKGVFFMEYEDRRVVPVDGGYMTIAEYEKYVAYELGFETVEDMIECEGGRYF